MQIAKAAGREAHNEAWHKHNSLLQKIPRVANSAINFTDLHEHIFVQFFGRSSSSQNIESNHKNWRKITWFLQENVLFFCATSIATPSSRSQDWTVHLFTAAKVRRPTLWGTVKNYRGWPPDECCKISYPSFNGNGTICIWALGSYIIRCDRDKHEILRHGWCEKKDIVLPICLPFRYDKASSEAMIWETFFWGYVSYPFRGRNVLMAR